MSKRFTLSAAGLAVVLASCQAPGGAGDQDGVHISHREGLGPPCALYLSDLDPLWGSLLLGGRDDVPGTEVQVEDIGGFGTTSVEKPATIDRFGLRLQSAKVVFTTATTHRRLMFVALPQAGPYRLEVDGQLFESPTFEGLDQASIPDVRVDVFEQPLDTRRLYVAGDFQEVAVGGADLYVFAGCGPFDHLLRPPYALSYAPEPLDGAWYGVEVGTIGAADRVVDALLLRGIRYSSLGHSIDRLGVTVAVWEVDPADPQQGTLVHEQVRNWYAVLPVGGIGTKTLPPQPPPFGMSVALPVSPGLTLQSDKQYRVMARVATVPSSAGDAGRWFFGFPSSEGWFPDDSGDFEVLGTFREEQKVFPVTPMPVDPAKPAEMRFSLIGMETHAAP